MRIALRRREKPFVAGDAVGPVRAATARVVLARTSEPPLLSVMPMPIRPPRLCAMGMSRGS